MRQHYDEFQSRNTEIVNLGPDDAEKYRAYWAENDMPFVGLADPDHTVAKQYAQVVSIFKFGRMPMQLLVDPSGVIRYLHASSSMKDIPRDDAVLAELDRLQG